MVEIAKIMSATRVDYEKKYELSYQQHKVLNHITSCRTSLQGGHKEVCPECGEVRLAYNSCRDRHCPKCQAYKKQKWIAKQSEDLLNIGYYHVVFTVPCELNSVFYANQTLSYNLLFTCAWETLKTFASDSKYLGAQSGATAILHTWGRTLQYHPHIHMIVPGGGLTQAGTWKKTGKNFFAPVKAMSKVFRGKLLSALKEKRSSLSFCGSAQEFSDADKFYELINTLFVKSWNVYCKPPFRDAGCVLKYLGAYVARVAISESRIISFSNDKVTFKYRDSKDNRLKEMTLDKVEFMRRFLMHILPAGFTKIRHYGLLASKDKRKRIDLCKRLTHTPVTERIKINAEQIITKMIGHKPGVCVHCGCKLVYLPLDYPQLC